jgi:hypothetical protein
VTDTAIVVTACGRTASLERSLPQLRALGCPVLVVDDSRSPEAAEGCLLETVKAKCLYLRVPENRGLACALNIGFSYWLADPAIKWISYFQDDVDVDSLTLKVLRDVQHPSERPLLTARHAREHKIERTDTVAGVRVLMKRSTTGTHLHVHRDYLVGVMPIPTRELGAPKPIPGQQRGLGSNVDWWIATWAPRSVGATGSFVACVPGLVRTFYVKRHESCWDNEHVAGEDPPLSREAIISWKGLSNA